MAIVLEKNNVVIVEETDMSKTTRFICRKCVRALEGFQTARKKLLRSAEAALQCMSSRPKAGTSAEESHSILPSDEDYACELVIQAKRARTTQNPSIRTSPVVQVNSKLGVKHKLSGCPGITIRLIIISVALDQWTCGPLNL